MPCIELIRAPVVALRVGRACGHVLRRTEQRPAAKRRQLPDPLANPPPAHRCERERLQDYQVERPSEGVGLRARGHGHLHMARSCSCRVEVYLVAPIAVNRNGQVCLTGDEPPDREAGW